MPYLVVTRTSYGYEIHTDYHYMRYIDYTKKEAIRHFRRQFGLVYKHMKLIEL